MSAISTAIVTSIIVWCVMRRPPSPAGTGAVMMIKESLS